MTRDDFYHAAIVSGVIDEAAVHDAESYDGGATLAKLDAMFEALQAEPKCATCSAPFVRIGDGYAPMCVCHAKATVSVEPKEKPACHHLPLQAPWCNVCNPQNRGAEHE